MINRCTIDDIEQTNMYAHKECICQTIAKEYCAKRTGSLVFLQMSFVALWFECLKPCACNARAHTKSTPLCLFDQCTNLSLFSTSRPQERT